jgi:hypothetical protein
MAGRGCAGPRMPPRVRADAVGAVKATGIETRLQGRNWLRLRLNISRQQF